MSLIDIYLKELKVYFDEDDIEAYNDLKEDLTEQWEECLLEGMTEEEAIATFSSPRTIAEDYFIDRSIETAEKAKTYVVPKEEVNAVFYRTQKNQWKKMIRNLSKGLKKLVRLSLLIIIMISFWYIVQELYNEQHLAKIPLISMFISIGGILFFIPKKSKVILFIKIIVFAGAGLIVVISQMKDDIFYQGVKYYHKFILEEDKNLKFILETGPNIEITTVNVAEDEPFEFILKGKYTKKDIKQLENEKFGDIVKISLNTDSWNNLFTSNEKKEIILFIPEKKSVGSLNVKSSNGDLRLLDFEVDKLDITLDEGDIYIKNLLVNEGIITSTEGDIILEESQGNLEINNKIGKNVITKFQGNIDIKSASAISILKKLNSKDVSIKSDVGRLVLEDSSIDQLKASSNGGQQVVKNTTGDLNIETDEGRIVAEELKGKIKLQTNSGPIISVQTSSIDAEVKSKTGFIKWLQSNSDDILINTSVGKEKISNDFSDTIAPTVVVDITSESGTIKVIRKVD